ncbi:MAG: hypothetical protein RLZ10_815 [Bacteroidota bacterium]|jgi:hypothetical protein
MKKYFVLFLLIVASPLVYSKGMSDLVLNTIKNNPHVPSEVLVQYAKGVTESDKSNFLRQFGGVRKEIVVTERSRSDNKGSLELVKIPLGIAISDLIRFSENENNVDFIEPNWIYSHTATSDDPQLTNLWGMSSGYGTNAVQAWTNNRQNCSSSYVGIIDEGYMFNHVDLIANAGKNSGEIAGDLLDNDGNGLIDDVYGWDFVNNNNTVFDGVGDDHGTHVAGTIGATGGNGIGVVGVCWNVKLISAKFLGSNGGTLANAVKAVIYLTDLKTRNNLKIVATNNSWGGGGYSQALYDAIARAGSAEILFVAAAGNNSSNNDSVASYPASYNLPNIISVASINENGSLSYFSNFGATSVDLGAPGSSILSTVPVSSKRKIVSGYAKYNGTSMATPHVTGFIAMYASLYPNASASEIKAALLSSFVTPTSSLSGKTLTGGRLNIGAMP